MPLGETLRRAREARGLSASTVAEATHMMVQMVEELEREDFRRIAAPIYGKGFIRLYAEHVGLDPEPLIKEYMNRHVGASASAHWDMDQGALLAPRPAIGEDADASASVDADEAPETEPGDDNSHPAQSDLFALAESKARTGRGRRRRAVPEKPKAAAAQSTRDSAPAALPDPMERLAQATNQAWRACAEGARDLCSRVPWPADVSVRRLLVVSIVGLLVVATVVALAIAMLHRRAPADVDSLELPLTQRVIPPPLPYVD